jgi:hypothetical protein
MGQQRTLGLANTILTWATPFTPVGRCLPLVYEVGESVHVVGGREDAVQVGESIVRGEGDELLMAPKCRRSVVVPFE